MLVKSKDASAPRDPRGVIVRMFLKSVIGGAAAFVLAAVLAPRFFDMRDDLMVAAAFAAWLACPLLIFLVGWDVVADWRRWNEHSRR
jgi:uncharacterized membrane protein